MNCLVDPELTPPELNLFHHIYRTAVQLLARDGRLQPVAFFRVSANPQIPGPKQGMLVPVGIDMPGTDYGKDWIAHILRLLVKKLDADLVLMVVESWMVKPTQAETEYFKHEGCFPIPPSKHRDRTEGVLFSIDKPDGRTWSAWVPIHRDVNRKPSIPDEPPKLEYLTTRGRFGNLFTPASTGGQTHVRNISDS